MSSFISQNFTEIEAVTGCTFACICHTVFCMFSCLQINWQPSRGVLAIFKCGSVRMKGQIQTQKYGFTVNFAPKNIGSCISSTQKYG